jgi:hypothetical protein
MFTTQYTQNPYVKQTHFAFKGLIAFIVYGCMADVIIVIYLGDVITPDILFHSHFTNTLL